MLTKGAIGNLINRYRAVLKKCNLINTFGSLAVASMLVLGGAGVAGAAGPITTEQTFSSSDSPYKGYTFQLASPASATAHGGALKTTGEVTLEECTFTNNYFSKTSSPRFGQAVASESVLFIKNSSFKENIYDSAGNNKAKYTYGTVAIYNSTGDLTLDNVSFEGNKAHSGALYIGKDAKAKITNTKFIKNEATMNSAGIALDSGSTLTVNSDNIFVGNGGACFGGAISMKHIQDWAPSTATIAGTNNKFIANKAAHGGAVYVLNGSFESDSSSVITFKNNYAYLNGYGNGGAIYCGSEPHNTTGEKYVGKVKLDGNVTFTNNIALNNGGAIYNSKDGVIEFLGNITFEENYANATVTESTVTDEETGISYTKYVVANGTPNDIHNEGTINVTGGTSTLYGGITGKASIDVAEGAALVIDTVEAGSKALEGAIAITGEGDITLKSKQSLLDGAVAHSISGNNITLESAEGKIIHSDDPDRTIEGSGDIKLVSHKDDVLYTANGSDVVGSPNDPAQIAIKGFQNLTMSTEDGYAIGNNGGNVTVTGGNVTIASGGRGAVANYSVHNDSEYCSTVIESTGKVSITAEGTVPASKTEARYKAAVYAQVGSIDISGQNIEIFDKLTASDDTFAVHAKGGSISLDAKNALEITGKVKVEGDGVLSLGGSNGTMKAGSLDVAGGKAMLKNVSASVAELAVSDGGMSVIDSELTIGKMTATGGTFFADPSTVIIKELTDNELGTAATIGADTAVVIGGASIEDAVAGASDFTDGKAALVLGKHIKLSSTGGLLVDPNAKESDVPAAGTATFAAGSLLAVDGHHADSDEEPAIITGSGASALTVSGDATLYISNAAANETYTIAEGFSSYDVANSAWSQDAGTLILNGLVEGDIKALTHDDGTVEIVTSTKVKEDSVFFDAIPSTALHELAEAGGDVDAADTGLVPQGKKFLSRAVDPTFMPDEGVAVDTINEVSRAAVTAGVQNTALRISDTASSTVLGHMSLAQHDGSSAIHSNGVDFWAAPMYGNLYTSGMVTSGSSVRGQFGGLALGADLEAGQFLGGKFRLGAAINGGGGQSETKGTATSTQNDYDFGGLNFYAGWNSGAFNLIASVGYAFGNHEVEMGIPVAGVNKAKADIDTSAFTADLRAEYQLKTPYVDILPHAGIRYTALKTDAHDLKANGSVLNSVQSDTQNIVQFPVGVTLSKDFALAGWNVKPSADVSVIPAAGEKKATTKVNFSGLDAWDSVNTRVMDSTSWAGTVGIQAEKGSMTFGLNYGVQASSNETDQNIQVKFGWKF